MIKCSTPKSKVSNHTFRSDLYYLGKRLERAVRTLISKPVQRADNPFATHLPILIGIARIFQVRRVLEFGCGLYSTLTFLDRSAFPDLEVLHLFENNHFWMDLIASMIGDDPRADLTFAGESIGSVLPIIQFQCCDLIFIDDSVTEDERVATIRGVADRCHASAIIVLHDYEVYAYREAVSTFENRFAFTALNPNTGVVWNQASLSKHGLRRLNSLIKQYARLVKPEERNCWVHVLNTDSWQPSI